MPLGARFIFMSSFITAWAFMTLSLGASLHDFSAVRKKNGPRKTMAMHSESRSFKGLLLLRGLGSFRPGKAVMDFLAYFLCFAIFRA